MTEIRNLTAFRKLILPIKITTIMTIAVFVLYQIAFVNESTIVHGSPDNKSLPDFNFVAVGDWSCTSNTQNTLNNIIDKSPELVLALGDLGYNQTACWLDLIDPIDDKMKIAIGNHDHQVYKNKDEYFPSPELLQKYMDYFNLSSQFYSFNVQNVHFVAISTESPYEKGSEQYKFVMEDLQKTISNSSVDWIVAFYHKAAYSSPGSIESIANFTDTYHPLFEKYGVDLVLQAHVHNYQRSYPIQYNSTLTPFITNRNITDYQNPDGQIFTIIGTGGAPDIHDFTGSAPYTAMQFNAFGLLNIDVLHNGTKLVGNFYENNGTVKDHFIIVKTKNETKQAKSSSPSISALPSQPRLINGNENKFRIESVVKGLRSPTDIVFIGPQDMIVLEKQTGTVKRVVNGQILKQPLLDVNVANKNERGLLGAAVSNADNDINHVFLYYTESKSDGDDICSSNCNSLNEPIGNRLYRYELTRDSTKLINPTLFLDLPAIPGPMHNGGKMIVDGHKNIFLIVGDIGEDHMRTQNYENGKRPTGTGGILKINQDGNLSQTGLLGKTYPLNLYYAYGIRNGFGLDIDPVTNNLWDTENGPDFGDEINLVRPGFNSGWKDVQGIWNHEGGKMQVGPTRLNELVDYNRKGNYSDPEFTWTDNVGPTAIKFFNSDKMGLEYKDSIFVGDFLDGNIYHFDLNEDRTSLLLSGNLKNKVADTTEELEKIIFGTGFSGITDLELGPDGYLYILSMGNGEIYRIVPK